MQMKSISITVDFVPRAVDVIAKSLEDDQEYTYTATTRRAAKRLAEILQKVADAYPGSDDFLELNVSTDDSLTILPDA